MTPTDGELISNYQGKFFVLDALTNPGEPQRHVCQKASELDAWVQYYISLGVELNYLRAIFMNNRRPTLFDVCTQTGAVLYVTDLTERFADPVVKELVKQMLKTDHGHTGATLIRRTLKALRFTKDEDPEEWDDAERRLGGVLAGWRHNKAWAYGDILPPFLMKRHVRRGPPGNQVDAFEYEMLECLRLEWREHDPHFQSYPSPSMAAHMAHAWMAFTDVQDIPNYLDKLPVVFELSDGTIIPLSVLEQFLTAQKAQ